MRASALVMSLATVVCLSLASPSLAEPVMGRERLRSLVSFSPDAVVPLSTSLVAMARPPIRFDASRARPPALDDPSPAAAQSARPRVAVQYSEAYVKRANLHRLASWTMLPLFGAEAFIGQSLYSNPTEAKKTAHLVIGGAIGGLFALNSVTGIWNLIEARHDPEKRGKRTLHAVLMLAADAGFVATVMLGPESEHGTVEGSRSAHRAMAFTAISTATVGYLIMLFDPH